VNVDEENDRSIGGQLVVNWWSTTSINWPIWMSMKLVSVSAFGGQDRAELVVKRHVSSSNMVSDFVLSPDEVYSTPLKLHNGPVQQVSNALLD
jgi:hypothetical protein